MSKHIRTFVTSILIILILAYSGEAKQNHKHRPKYVDYWLSGFNLLKTAGFNKFDPGSDYCLIATNDQSEADHRLFLLSDLRFAGYEDGGVRGELNRFRSTFQRVKIDLNTGLGLSMGNTTQRVRRKLGKPRHVGYRYSGNLKVYSYSRVYWQNKQKRKYSANYTFYHNRLWAIEFRDSTLASMQ